MASRKKKIELCSQFSTLKSKLFSNSYFKKVIFIHIHYEKDYLGTLMIPYPHKIYDSIPFSSNTAVLYMVSPKQTFQIEHIISSLQYTTSLLPLLPVNIRKTVTTFTPTTITLSLPLSPSLSPSLSLSLTHTHQAPRKQQ
jgi:hypothetical protein